MGYSLSSTCMLAHIHSVYAQWLMMHGTDDEEPISGPLEFDFIQY